MISRYTHEGATWINVSNPSRDEILALSKEFSFDKNISTVLPETISRSALSVYKDHIYLVLQFPTSTSKEGVSKRFEVDFVIGKNFLLTAHFEEIPALATLIEEFKNCSDEKGVCVFENTEDITFRVIGALYEKSGKELEHIEREIHMIEEHIFSGERRKTVEHISRVNHLLLEFKKAIRFHKEILHRLLEEVKERIPKAAHLVYELKTEQEKLWNSIEHNREILSDLKETNDSLINYRTNEIIKAVTLLNVIALPLVFVPGLIAEHDRVIANLIIALVISIVAYFYFKIKRWF